MPSPIIHLDLLFQLQEHQLLNINPELLLGNLSPDAIHMRLNQTWSDKAKTHFYQQADISYQLAIQTAMSALESTDPNFCRGYLIHLYTDYLWRDQIYTTFFNTYKTSMERSQLHALYYKEMQHLDQIQFSQANWLEQAQNSLKAAKIPEAFPLLTKDELNSWRSKILEQDLQLKLEPGLDLTHSHLFTKTMIHTFHQTVIMHLEAWLS